MAVERFPVEAGHIMMFARSIGDPNPAYERGEHAPPTFVQASAQFDPDYGLRPKIGQPWFGSGKEPSGIRREPSAGGGRGDVLTATTTPGKRWEKEGRRAGKLVFSESVTEYRDQNGELVVTATGVGVRTERPVEG
jgi:hypothetical protein